MRRSRDVVPPQFPQDEFTSSLNQLAVLTLLVDAQHGYNLMRVLKSHGIRIESGTLYPMLRRLEARGLLNSTWDTSGPRPRKVYVTTDQGREVLEKLVPLWRSFIEASQKVFDSTGAGYEGPCKGSDLRSGTHRPQDDGEKVRDQDPDEGSGERR